MKGIDMANGTCSLPGCDSKVRARDLCSTHYNHAHQPDRHRKVEVACGYCGESCMKEPGTKFQARFCSLICRDLWRIEQDINPCPSKDPLWVGHPVGDDLALLRSTQHWKRRLHAGLRLARVEIGRMACASLWQARPCVECEAVFVPLSTTQACCGRRCARRIAKRARRAREMGAIGSYTWPEVMHLFILFDRRCAYCEQSIDGQPDPDHVVPLSRGGSNSLTNILPCCRSCNTDKRDLSLDEWSADRERRGLLSVTTTWAVSDRRIRHLTSLTQGSYRTDRVA